MAHNTSRQIASILGDMRVNDLLMIILGIFIVLWLILAAVSGCQVGDTPFSFFAGCTNYGIDWNSFMTPAGWVVLFGVPLLVLYKLARFGSLMLTAIWQKSGFGKKI